MTHHIDGYDLFCIQTLQHQASPTEDVACACANMLQQEGYVIPQRSAQLIMAEAAALLSTTANH